MQGFGILSLLVWLPIAGGIAVLALGDRRVALARWLALAVALATVAITIPLWMGFDRGTAEFQFVERLPWITAFNSWYHLGVDGISLPLIVLTAVMTVPVIIAAWTVIEKRPAQYCAAFLINSSNPTGKVFTREELQTILDLAEKHDAFVITNEPYEHIVYEPRQHVYMHSLPSASERVIVCNSLSKTYSITGWRLDYVQAAPHIIAQARKVHDFLTVGAAAPLQEATIAGLELPDSYYAGLRATYTAKRDVFLSHLRRTGLPFTEPQGAYYVLLDISSLGFATDTEAAEWFVREIGVAGVPGSSFFREPEHRFIRFHFAKKEDTLHAAGEKLAAVAKR